MAVDVGSFLQLLMMLQDAKGPKKDPWDWQGGSTGKGPWGNIPPPPGSGFSRNPTQPYSPGYQSREDLLGAAGGGRAMSKFSPKD